MLNGELIAASEDEDKNVFVHVVSTDKSKIEKNVKGLIFKALKMTKKISNSNAKKYVN
jgi:hypothetical protein